MKATLPDGTVLEGTPEEVREVIKPPMFVHYPLVAAACAPWFGGPVWTGEIKPTLAALNAACVNPQASWFVPPPGSLV